MSRYFQLTLSPVAIITIDRQVARMKVPVSLHALATLGGLETV